MNKWFKCFIALTALFPALWFCIMASVAFFINLISLNIENAIWGFSFVSCFYIYICFLKSIFNEFGNKHE